MINFEVQYWITVLACPWVVKEWSWVNEGDHDVTSALGDCQSFMEVGQSSRMHEGPAKPGLCHTAVVADKATSSSLCV